MTTGILPLGRATFDVAYAEEKLGAMLARLDAAGVATTGPRMLLMDADTTRAAIADLKAMQVERLIILQVTFTDAAMTVEAARAFDGPLGIWAVPEPRLGGRLRLNAFCGLNLASHALGLNGRAFSWAYGDPDMLDDADLQSLLSGTPTGSPLQGRAADTSPDAGRRITDAIAGRRIGRIGEHPDGFDTCAYAPEKLDALAGVSVEEIGLDTLFSAARAVDAQAVETVHRSARADMDGLDEVDAVELDRSLRLKLVLSDMHQTAGLDAFAIRCWPETFTEYGGAVCGPVSMMGETRVPCACEADVYGALTQMILQEAAQAPVFLTDLVDIDRTDDSAVLWHCGQAPVSMCAPATRPQATIHTNRKMPLLYQFALKPGRVTLMRISQAFGSPKMILAGGEMLHRPMAFTGTSGILRFDSGAGPALEHIMASGMEHHMAVVYGEHRPLLESVAAAMAIPVVEL